MPANEANHIVQLPQALVAFAGFSLEKRREWSQGPWRCRILPNKNERCDYRIEVFGESAQAAVNAAHAALLAIEEVAK